MGKITLADEKSWIMCADTSGVDNFTEGDGPNGDHEIVPRHAYLVIACKEHEDVRLMNIRNP